MTLAGSDCEICATTSMRSARGCLPRGSWRRFTPASKPLRQIMASAWAATTVVLRARLPPPFAPMRPVSRQEEECRRAKTHTLRGFVCLPASGRRVGGTHGIGPSPGPRTSATATALGASAHCRHTGADLRRGRHIVSPWASSSIICCYAKRWSTTCLGTRKST